MKLKKNIALSDSGFLFNPSTGDSYSINPIGVSIVKALQEGKTNADIVTQITDEYRIDRDTAEKDLDDFKKMLHSFHLTEGE